MQPCIQIPTLQERTEAYHFLQDPHSRLTEEQTLAFAHWSRFDPRLGEILVVKLQGDWVHLNPLLLNISSKSSPWPQTLGVILDHVLELEHSPKFKLFADLAVDEIGPVNYQAFSIGLFQPGGLRQRRCSEQPLRLFARWGFYASHPFFHRPDQMKRKTTLAPAVRKRILQTLLKNRNSFSVTDYILACDGRLHRRQAERDLKTFFKLKTKGQTRARKYY